MDAVDRAYVAVEEMVQRLAFRARIQHSGALRAHVSCVSPIPSRTRRVIIPNIVWCLC